jgi:hypothetical protein
VLPDTLARHVVFAAKVDVSRVVYVGTFEGRRICLAVVETPNDAPFWIGSPRWIGDNNLVPIGDQRIGEHQLASTSFVNDLLLTVPLRLGRVGAPLLCFPLGMFVRIAVRMGAVMQANHRDSAIRPANTHALHYVQGRLRCPRLYAFQNLCCFSFRHYE